MTEATKTVWVREWIIFALSIGLGGHVALGLILHNPSTLKNVWWNTFSIGLFIYILFQAGRSVVLWLRARRAKRHLS
jgi:uncharacterized protein (DUF2062 family)